MQDSSTDRRARGATLLAFATNGALPATLLARYAEVKETLDLDAAAFGLVAAGFMVGAALAFNTPGIFLRRWGSRRVAALGTVWIAAALLLGAGGIVSGQLWIFVAGLALAGYGDAVVDVAQNAQGLRVQSAFGRSLLSSMHAGWSVGAAIGGLIGTLAASLGVPLTVHLGVWGIICVVVIYRSSRSFLPDGGKEALDETIGGLPRGAVRLLVPLVLIALGGVAVEDFGNNWSAILLATERGVAASAAGLGLSVMLAAQFIGRLVGDRFIDRLGRRAALLTSLGLIVIGFLVTAWLPWALSSYLGLALAGLGCAITVPLAFAAADALPGFRRHAAVSWVNWCMRASTIALTPVVGGIAALSSLPVAVTAVSGIAVLAIIVQLWPRR